MNSPHLLFVTGKLAEPALRKTLAELAVRAGFQYSISVLPITVAALATTSWIARHLTVPEKVERVILPGLCSGDLSALAGTTTLPVERGPADLRDLPEFFGKDSGRPADYGAYDIQILAEINHAPRLMLGEILSQARALRASGADIIDLGCDPGDPWAGVREAVHALREEGLHVSIDSFNPPEVEAAVTAGAELVLSVNQTNLSAARSWGCEVVALPDDPAPTKGPDDTAESLLARAIPFRTDAVTAPTVSGSPA